MNITGVMFIKKIISAISLSAIVLLFCACGTSISDSPSGSLPAERETAAADTATLAADTSTPAVTETQPFSDPLLLSVPSEGWEKYFADKTIVFRSAKDMMDLNTLFESLLSGEDTLEFAVSSIFGGEKYLMGFVYQESDYIVFSRVIGLRLKGETIEGAFLSDNFDNPEGLCAENCEDEDEFTDTSAFEYNGMAVVSTDGWLNNDEPLTSIFVIDQTGILCNICNYYCTVKPHDGKLLFYEDFGKWSELIKQGGKASLKPVTDYAPYLPKVRESDFVIKLEDYVPQSGEDSYDNEIRLNVGGSQLTIEDFDLVEEDAGYGTLYYYTSKKEYKAERGADIIFIYPPGYEISCTIATVRKNAAGKCSNLPGAVIYNGGGRGNYTIRIESYGEFFDVRVYIG